MQRVRWPPGLACRTCTAGATGQFSSGRTLFNRSSARSRELIGGKIHFIALIVKYRGREEGLGRKGEGGGGTGGKDTGKCEAVEYRRKIHRGSPRTGTGGAINERALHRKPISPIFSQLYEADGCTWFPPAIFLSSPFPLLSPRGAKFSVYAHVTIIRSCVITHSRSALR